MSGKEALAAAPKSGPAPARPPVRNDPNPVLASPKPRELGNSSADIDLVKVESDIAKLERQPTLEKVARAYGTIDEAMKANRAKRSGPLSPERFQAMDDEYAKLKQQGDQLWRLAWGRTPDEASHQFSVNLGIAPGMKQAKMAEGPLIPREAEVRAKLAPLYEKRDALRATVDERREKRREQEAKRAAVVPRSTEERVQQALADGGVSVRRPMTDFEVALAQDPEAMPTLDGKVAHFKNNKLRAINSPITGEPAYYVYENSGYHENYDIHGKFLGSGEIPIETPLLDPIDIILIGEGVGSLVVKGVSAGAKVVAAEAPRVGARLLRKAGTGVAAMQIGLAEAAPVVARGGAGLAGETSSIVARSGSRELAGAAARGGGEDLAAAAARGSAQELSIAPARAAAEEGATVPTQALAQNAAADATSAAAAAPTAIAPQATTQAVAQAAARVDKSPSAVAQALRTRYGGRLTDSNNALENLITRVRDDALRQHGRAASSEMADIIRILEDGAVDGKAVARVELVPSSSAGRTPDLRIHFADGSQTAWEVRSLTSAPRNRVVAKADGGRGALARSLAEATQARPVNAGDIGRAILSKARNTPARPSQIAGGGTISIHVNAAGISQATANNAVQSIASQLGAHVERIEISFIGGRALPTDAATREIMAFVRQPNGSYLLQP